MASADPEEPAGSAAHLGGHRRDVVAEERRHPPGGREVAVEAVALVLRQHCDAPVAAVDQVRQDEVDEAVDAAEGHGGLRAVERKRSEALALAAGEHHAEDARGMAAGGGDWAHRASDSTIAFCVPHGTGPLHDQGAVKPAALCAPSQNGLLAEWPQRQSAAFVPCHCVVASAERTVRLPVTRLGPSGLGWTSSGPPTSIGVPAEATAPASWNPAVAWLTVAEGLALRVAAATEHRA